MLHNQLCCSFFILFPSVHISLFMFCVTSFCPQSISFISSTIVHPIHFIYPSPSHSHLPHLVAFISFNISFNFIVTFTLQPIPSLEVKELGVSLDKVLVLDIHYLKLNCSGFTTPCLFIPNKYNRINLILVLGSTL